MTPDEIGLMRAVMSIALLLSVFSSFGTGAVIIRYFPLKGSTQEALNQLFTFGLVVVLCAFTVLAAALYTFSDAFFHFFEDKSPEVGQYLLLISVLILQMTIFNLLEITARSQKQIVIPNMIRDLVYKILHALLIVLFGYGFFDINEYLYGVAAIYCVLILVLSIFTFVKYKIRLDFSLTSKRADFKTLFNYSTIGILTGLGYVLMVQVDQVMITKLLGLTENGIYTTAIFMVIAVEVPSRFISQIATTVISDKLAQSDTAGLEDVYKKASINQFILGALIYSLVLINLNSLYIIMPNGQKFNDGWWVFMVMGLVKLMDMTFSLNGEIIGYSKHYKFNLYALIILSLIAIILNFLLIPPFGIMGAALATFIAYILFNIVKYWFVKKKYGISPFGIKNITGIVSFLALLTLSFQFNAVSNPYYDILLRSTLFGGAYILVMYQLKISDLFNSLCDQILSTITNSFKQ